LVEGIRAQGGGNEGYRPRERRESKEVISKKILKRPSGTKFSVGGGLKSSRDWGERLEKTFRKNY